MFKTDAIFTVPISKFYFAREIFSAAYALNTKSIPNKSFMVSDGLGLFQSYIVSGEEYTLAR